LRETYISSNIPGGIAPLLSYLTLKKLVLGGITKILYA
jgi:hypothetical protein